MIFLMISTQNSQRFTAPSAASLIKQTPIGAGDKVVIVDNDGTLGDLPGATVIRNETRRSFAQNANFGLALSAVLCDDLMLLNNDIIYTKNWLDFLKPQENQILVPFCNQNAQYHFGELKLNFTMDYEDYDEREDELEFIAQFHRQQSAALPTVTAEPLISFFCVYIPRAISAKLGNFDESFGRGGGEDVDYRLRALLAGFEVSLVRQCYLLHFMGKSTWRSGEPAHDTALANLTYQRRFVEKWGSPVAEFFLAGPHKLDIADRYGVRAELERSDFRGLLQRLMARPMPPVLSAVDR
jgi:GT2 family glycosyltransferase